jgi:hypothetical protein
MAGQSCWAREKWRIVRTIAMIIAFRPIASALPQDLLAALVAGSVAVTIDCTIHYFKLRRESRREAPPQPPTTGRYP